MSSECAVKSWYGDESQDPNLVSFFNAVFYRTGEQHETIHAPVRIGHDAAQQIPRLKATGM